MKIELSEHEGSFMLNIQPEDIKEINKLFRFVNGAKKKSLSLELLFYAEGNTNCYIQFAKNKTKSIGLFNQQSK